MWKAFKVSYGDKTDKPMIRLSGYWLRDLYGIEVGGWVSLEMIEGCVVVRKLDKEAEIERVNKLI